MQTPTKRLRALVAPLILAALVACTSIGFNGKLAEGYSITAATRDTAGTLLDAGELTPDQAQEIQNGADGVRFGLDEAKKLYAIDRSSAAGKLNAVLIGLDDVRAKLAEYAGEHGEPTEAPDDAN